MYRCKSTLINFYLKKVPPEKLLENPLKSPLFQVEDLLEKVKSGFATSGLHNPGEKSKAHPWGHS